MRLFSIITAFLVFVMSPFEAVHAETGSAVLPLKDNDLYALAACLMDADSGRVLYGKNVDEVRAMASTTKIMTLIIALEYGNAEDTVTISPYAASMPDVQLNVRAGEQYRLGDLCYAMMLESYNDIAAAIAEHIGMAYADIDINDTEKRSIDDSRKCVSAFAGLMNDKARELGCENTYFITPNGLDAEDENGKHSTTARELALIASYAVKKDDFNAITGTKQYSFGEINGKRSCNVYNKDAFLNQMSGAFGIKTGFTGNAGYCFVGALKSDGRTFISVVLGSGWPSARTYKWKDTRKLMEYGINNFFEQKIFTTVEEYKSVEVTDGIGDSVGTRIEGELSMLISSSDEVKVVYELEDSVKAPVYENDKLGKAIVYVNGERVALFPITASGDVKQVGFNWFLKELMKAFCL